MLWTFASSNREAEAGEFVVDSFLKSEASARTLKGEKHVHTLKSEKRDGLRYFEIFKVCQ